MKQRKLRKTDEHLLADAIKRFTKIHGKDAVREFITLFEGNAIYIVISDDGHAIQGIKVVSPDNGTIATMTSTQVAIDFPMEAEEPPAEATNDQKLHARGFLDEPADTYSVMSQEEIDDALDFSMPGSPFRPDEPVETEATEDFLFPEREGQEDASSVKTDEKHPAPVVKIIPSKNDDEPIGVADEISPCDEGEEEAEPPIPTIESAAPYANIPFGAAAAGLSSTGFLTPVPPPASDNMPVEYGEDPFAKNDMDLPDIMEQDEWQYGVSSPSIEFDADEGAAEPPMPSTQEKPKKHTLRNVILVLLALILVACAGAFAYVTFSGTQLSSLLPSLPNGSQKQESNEPDYDAYAQVSPTTMGRINVVSGNTAYDIRQKLLDIGMVNAAKNFVTTVESQEAANSLQAGRYMILGNETAGEIVSRMMCGDLVPDGVIGVNEGDDIYDIAKAIDAAKLSYSGNDFLMAVRDVEAYRPKFSMLSAMPAGLPSLEGYLYSDEYNLNAASNAHEAVEMMLRPTQSWFESLKITPAEWHAILTKASMIEKEAMYDEDRPLIASVIDNRLVRGMNLQIDATVKYANNSDAQRVMESDLEVDSPYNTYRVSGLPIGPICSGLPKKDIEAVMTHEPTEFIFYVLKDKQGHHTFTTNAEDFEVAKQHYLEIFNYTD